MAQDMGIKDDLLPRLQVATRSLCNSADTASISYGAFNLNELFNQTNMKQACSNSGNPWRGARGQPTSAI